MKNFFNNIFKFEEDKNIHNFKIDESSNNIDNNSSTINENLTLSTSLSNNIEYLKSIYKSNISSDINIREFKIPIKNKKYNASLFFIDGVTDTISINDFILKPLLLKNSIEMKDSSTDIKKSNNLAETTPKSLTVKKFNLENFIYDSLIPQASVTKENQIKNIVEKINNGFTLLLIDTIPNGFLIETKGVKFRSISEPLTEPIIKGAHQGFVENLRVNTSLIRKIINNENLVIENLTCGTETKTDVSICYMSNITNESLISEVKYRLNNINLDYIIFPNDIENLIIDNPSSIFPETSSTERPDKAALNILNGKVIILINGSPYAIIIPTLFIDYLAAAEDNNVKHFYANFLRIIRYFSFFCALFLPGLYVAITSFHQELIPSELLFAIIAARKAIPFPVIFEILIMEFSFELLQEASIRVSSSFSTTIGIIGALILGDAAVSANIVSPILIIIVAFTGISSFAIPDYSLKYSVRILRFLFIILGYLAGFLGIAFGTFIMFAYMSSLSSFGIPYFSPYIPKKKTTSLDNIFVRPVWQRNYRSFFLNTKKPNIEPNTSMEWRK